MSAPPRALPPTAGGPLTVGVIGAGRVGAVLGAALRAAGHRVVAALRPVSAAARARTAALLPAVPVRPADEVARAGTDLLLIAVPDDALAGRGGRTGRDRGAVRPGQVVAHTSGAHGLGVLAPAGAPGRRPARPAPGDDLHRHRRRPGPAARHLLRGHRAARPCGRWPPGSSPTSAASPEWIAEPARPLYHAALAHGANHLVTLVNEAADRLRDAGVRQPERVLAPLLRAALDNALRLRRRGADRARCPAATPARSPATWTGSQPTAPESRAGLPGAGPPHRRPGDRRRPAAAADAEPLLGRAGRRAGTGADVRA